MKTILSVATIMAFVLASLSLSANETHPIQKYHPSDTVNQTFGSFSNESFIVYPNSNYENLNLQFNLLKGAEVKCIISNEDGDIIKDLNLGYKPEGNRHVVLQLSDLPSGEYKLQLFAEKTSMVKWFKIP